MEPRHVCPCNWRGCAQYVYESDDTWNGVIQVKKFKNNRKNDEIRRVVEVHLKISAEVREGGHVYHVARHHWNRDLLREYLYQPDGRTRLRNLSTPIPSHIAKRYLIHKKVDQCQIKSQVITFMAAPNNPESLVKDFHQLQTSMMNARRSSREEKRQHVAGEPSVAVPIGDTEVTDVTPVPYESFDAALSDLPPFIQYCQRQCVNSSVAGTSTVTTTSSQQLYRCIGLMSPAVNSFAALSNENKGICLKYWSFTAVDQRFRSGQCMMSVRYSDQQCNQCLESKNSIRAREYPELFSHAYAVTNSQWLTNANALKHSPNQQSSELHCKLKDVRSSCSTINAFHKNVEVIATIRTLYFVKYNYESVALSDNEWLLFCPGIPDSFRTPGSSGNSQCSLYTISERNLGVRQCDNCNRETRNSSRREVRKLSNQSSQVAADSKTNWSLLTPARMKERLHNHKRMYKRNYMCLKRLQAKLSCLSSPDEVLDASDDQQLTQWVTDACTVITKDTRSTKELIITAMMVNSASSPGTAVDEQTKTKISEAANLIVDEIVNYGKVLNGKPKTVRFSPSVLRLALCLWSRSPSTYEEVRSSTFLMLPSQSTLKKMKCNMSVTEGICPKIYSWMQDEHNNYNIGISNRSSVGHIMCDEMKLKSGLVWNCMSNRVAGFVSDSDCGFDLNEELNVLLKLNSDMAIVNEEGKIEEPADDSEVVSYVNQWRFRSIYGETRNLEFYYNQGSLSGDGLMHQLIHVLIMLANINFTVLD